MYTEKQKELASKRFDTACKQASKCRAERKIVSCYSCKDFNTCEIQERANKNLAIKRGEFTWKQNVEQNS